MAEKNANPRVPMWIKLLLVASLGMNLLVAGLAVGTAWRFSKDGPSGKPPPGLSLVAALEPSDRRAVLSKLREDRRADRSRTTADMRALLSALRAEDLDTQVLTDVLTSQAERGRLIQASIESAWLERVTAMTVQEREAYADRLESHLQRRKPDRKDGHKPKRD
ncbi:periplasmic heavy metal sensor [Aliishimia ponticola]|nr:periplasmic heavy metal sensor [Aliishimia ponticola]